MKLTLIFTALAFLPDGCGNDPVSAEKYSGRRFTQNDKLLNEEVGTRQQKTTITTIRANFKQINAITKWSKVKEHFLEGSTEGGNGTYYYLNDELLKIKEVSYGETGQVLREYYLMDGELSFVFEKDLRYNRPIYWDEAHQKENNDTEAFDVEKSEITETRYYFTGGKLIHVITNKTAKTTPSKSQLREKEQLLSELFEDLLKLEI